MDEPEPVKAEEKELTDEENEEEEEEEEEEKRVKELVDEKKQQADEMDEAKKEAEERIEVQKYKEWLRMMRQKRIILRYEHLQPVYLLFNPWHESTLKPIFPISLPVTLTSVSIRAKTGPLVLE